MGFWNYYYHHQNWRDVLPRNAVFFFFNSHTTFVQKRQDKNVFSHYNTLKTTFHSLFFFFIRARSPCLRYLESRSFRFKKYLRLKAKVDNLLSCIPKEALLLLFLLFYSCYHNCFVLCTALFFNFFFLNAMELRWPTRVLTERQANEPITTVPLPNWQVNHLIMAVSFPSMLAY